MHRVGYRTGFETDSDRLSWDGSSARPLPWAVWYPASVSTGTEARPEAQFFDLGDVYLDPELATGGPFPVVLLSHGTGGAPESLGWLARHLAAHGFVVIGARHHGNTGGEPYLAEGFLCWWERALDLSALLSKLNAQGPLAGKLDFDRVHGLGFSLGGCTVLAMAGALSSMERYRDWTSKTGLFDSGPREFPDAANRLPELQKHSAVFRESWARHGDSFLDTRLRSVVAIAPAPTVRAFCPASLNGITLPVTLIAGGSDTEAPAEECAEWLLQVNPEFRYFNLGVDVGHYSFMGMPAQPPTPDEAPLFTDKPGVDRTAIHQRCTDIVVHAIQNASS